MTLPTSTCHSFHSRVLGRNLLVREWAGEEPFAGEVLLLHGLGDHSGRHDWAAGLALAAGFRVVSFDWPGNGESEGIRGDMPVVAEAIELLDEIVAAERLVLSGVFAHSTGAFLALPWLARRSRSPGLDSLRWVWLNSPLLRPSHGQAQWKIALATKLARRFPSLTLGTGVQVRKCFHTPCPPAAEAERRKSGGHHRIGLRFAADLIATEGSVSAEAATIRDDLSFLLTQGAEDEVCPPSYAEALYQLLPGRRKTWILAAGARHEAYREPEPESLTQAARAWLDAERQRGLNGTR